MNGFINFHKEPGQTSNKVLGSVKSVLGCKKAGFLGTLDPCASGILPIGIGWATKLFPYFEKTPKVYKSEIIFGSETDTQDATGKVIKTASDASVDAITKEKLRKAFLEFTGEIKQLPPMYSAKKIGGKRLYEIARKGGEVERQPKLVTIHSFELIEFGKGRATFTAKVSTGTYIRTLCVDIGRKLGSLAHMGELTRLASHVFTAKDSITLAELEKIKDDRSKWLLPLDFPLLSMKKLELTSTEERSLKNGTPIPWNDGGGENIRLYDSGGKFIGIGKTDGVVRKLFASKLVP